MTLKEPTSTADLTQPGLSEKGVSVEALPRMSWLLGMSVGNSLNC